jgi:hypothetical protein
MLRAKRKQTGEIVEAYFAIKSQALFYCPDYVSVFVGATA